MKKRENGGIVPNFKKFFPSPRNRKNRVDIKYIKNIS